MLKANIYKLLVMMGIHLEVRESKKTSVEESDRKELLSKGSKVKKALEGTPGFTGLLNKQNLFNEAVDEYLEKMKEKVDDTLISDYIISILKSADEDEKKIFLENLIWLSHANDRHVSQGELDILHHFYDVLGVSDENLEKNISDVINTYSDLTRKKQKKYTKKRFPPALLGGLIFLICALSIAGIAIYTFLDQSSDPLNKKLANISYKKINFDRYLALGNFNGDDRSDQTGKLVVFYLKGHADVEFDLSNLSIHKKPTGYKAVYTNPKAAKIGFNQTLPYIIDVNIDQRNIREILNVTPEELSEGQVEMASKVAGGVAAVGGGYVGAKLGKGIGKNIYPPIGTILGVAGGGVLGGSTAGVGSYVMMKKYLTGFKITGAVNESDKERLLEKAKSLIAAEIIMDENLSKTLTSDFERYVKSFYEGMGVNIQEIDYKSAA